MLKIELDFGTHDEPATFGELRRFVNVTSDYHDDDDLPIAMNENLEVYGIYGYLNHQEGDTGGT